MCELTMLEAGYTSAEIAKVRRERMRAELAHDVSEARALALLNQACWCDAYRDMDDDELLMITRHVMCGDALAVGRALRDALQRKVLAAATSHARDAFDARHDSSADALAALYPVVVP